MQNTDNKPADKFELYLDEMILKVQACQKERILDSCSECEKYLACELRGEYISAVYNSMSKGETGGFEF